MPGSKMHPARSRAIVGVTAVVSFAAATALLMIAPGAAFLVLAVAFAAAAAVAGTDSRELDPPR